VKSVTHTFNGYNVNAGSSVMSIY